MPTQNQIDTFQRAYVTAMLWSSCDDNGGPLDSRYDAADIAPDTMLRIAADCASFCYAQQVWIGDNYEQAGRDFWLTRCGHGAGFWDRDAGTYPHEASNDILTKASEAFGNLDPYIGDDNQIYI